MSFKFHRKISTLAFLSCLIVLLAACGSEPPQAPPPPEVTISKPIRQDVVKYGEFTGTTQAVQSVEVRARVSGELRSVNFEASSIVRKGQILFVIEHEQYEAVRNEAFASMRAAQADSANAESDLKRIELAIRSNAVSQQDLDRAQAQRDVAVAAVLAAKARLDRAELDLAYTQVHAPISGIVSRRFVDVGNIVSAGQATLLTTINQMDPMYVYFDAPERAVLEFIAIRTESEARKEKPETGMTRIGLSNENGYPHQGDIDYVDNTVDPATGTIQLRAVIPNSDGVLFPGLFVRVRVQGGIESDAILIDQKAVGADIGGKYVYTVDESNIVIRQYLTLGTAQDNGTTIVEEGLDGTENYIVNGILRARPGLPVSPVTEDAASSGS